VLYHVLLAKFFYLYFDGVVGEKSLGSLSMHTVIPFAKKENVVHMILFFNHMRSIFNENNF
jgi:hypothetical protein